MPRVAVLIIAAARRAAAPLDSAPLDSTQLNDLFITFLSPPLIAALRRLPLRVSTHFDSTICLLRRSDTPRGSTQRNTTPLNSTPLNVTNQ